MKQTLLLNLVLILFISFLAVAASAAPGLPNRIKCGIFTRTMALKLTRGDRNARIQSLMQRLRNESAQLSDIQRRAIFMEIAQLMPADQGIQMAYIQTDNFDQAATIAGGQPATYRTVTLDRENMMNLANGAVHRIPRGQDEVGLDPVFSAEEFFPPAATEAERAELEALRSVEFQVRSVESFLSRMNGGEMDLSNPYGQNSHIANDASDFMLLHLRYLSRDYYFELEKIKEYSETNNTDHWDRVVAIILERANELAVHEQQIEGVPLVMGLRSYMHRYLRPMDQRLDPSVIWPDAHIIGRNIGSEDDTVDNTPEELAQIDEAKTFVATPFLDRFKGRLSEDRSAELSAIQAPETIQQLQEMRAISGSIYREARTWLIDHINSKARGTQAKARLRAFMIYLSGELGDLSLHPDELWPNNRPRSGD